MKAVVVGGGIAGLAVASGLQRTGWAVEVFERSPDQQPGRAGLSLFGNGFQALAELGLGDAVRAICADAPPFTKSGLRRPDGKYLVTFSPEASRHLRAVDRTQLHTVLLNSLEPDTVRWGRRVNALDEITGADLVIGADGIRSRIRASLPWDRPTRRSGYGVWRALTSHPVPIGNGGETWGAAERFGLVPLEDGRVYWFGVVESTQNETGVAALEEIRARFGSWHEPIAELIDATDPEAVHYTDSEELDGPLASYVHGNTVLIGDAAHAMSPNLGQGANQALEDAATLCELLRTGPQDLTAALREYDRLRRPRTQSVARESHSIGIPARWRHPLLVRLREAGMTLAPDRVLSRRTIRLQQWKKRTVAK